MGPVLKKSLISFHPRLRHCCGKRRREVCNRQETDEGLGIVPPHRYYNHELILTVGTSTKQPVLDEKSPRQNIDEELVKLSYKS